MAKEGAGGQERSEDPTGKRRAQTREEGQVAKSSELSSAAVLLTATGILMTFGGTMFVEFASSTMRETLNAMSYSELGGYGAAGLVLSVTGSFMKTFLLYSAVLMGLAVLVNSMQVKGLLTLKPIMPKFSHVNPFEGVKRIFSGNSVFTGTKALLKFLAIGCVLWYLLSRSLPELLVLNDASIFTSVSMMKRMLFRFALLMGVAYLLMAVVDYAYQRRRIEQGMKMSKEEIRQENKETEGNPEVKHKILALARGFARRRMLQNVPQADVVVVNPTHIAVALKYDTSVSPAPMVMAMGQRKLAARIKEIARKANVPVVENKPIARALLATAEVGKPIPPALYAAVAEILAFVYRQKGRFKGVKDTMTARGSR
ncbi:MAG: flagellar biosynthesis protein FlhB, partial [Candidatus Eisenbacteria bacterium]|nr:flagellar biosynthesis protein FlhB [Candidatus Eisenbacteria bacterium]